MHHELALSLELRVLGDHLIRLTEDTHLELVTLALSLKIHISQLFSRRGREGEVGKEEGRGRREGGGREEEGRREWGGMEYMFHHFNCTWYLLHT